MPTYGPGIYATYTAQITATSLTIVSGAYTDTFDLSTLNGATLGSVCVNRYGECVFTAIYPNNGASYIGFAVFGLGSTGPAISSTPFSQISTGARLGVLANALIAPSGTLSLADDGTISNSGGGRAYFPPPYYNQFLQGTREAKFEVSSLGNNSYKEDYVTCTQGGLSVLKTTDCTVIWNNPERGTLPTSCTFGEECPLIDSNPANVISVTLIGNNTILLTGWFDKSSGAMCSMVPDPVATDLTWTASAEVSFPALPDKAPASR